MRTFTKKIEPFLKIVNALRQLLARPAAAGLASSLFAFGAAPPPAAPPLIFCARDFWKASAFHIIPQTESAKMVEIGRF